MKAKLWFVGILVITAIAGCVTLVGPIGRDFEKGRIRDIVIGQTTKAEIIKYLNVPFETRKMTLDNTEYEIFRYYYTHLEEGMYIAKVRVLDCEFKNDIVNGYIFNSTFKEEQHKFNEKERSKLEKGRTTKNDVLNLFGATSGKALLPTTLPFLNAPSGTREIWTYSYKYFKIISDTEKAYTKYLAAFFDSNSSLIDFSYVEE